MRLLVVEDNRNLARLLKKGLTKAGFAVDLGSNLSKARVALANSHYMAVVLDLGLADGEAPSLLRVLRERHRRIPIVVLTAGDAVEDCLAALRSGADDYLVKPFALPELVVRLEAVVLHAGRLIGSGLQVGNLVFDIESRQAVVDGKRHIVYGSREAALLGILIRRKGEVVSVRAIEEEAFGVPGGSFTRNAIEVHAHRLRRRMSTWGVRVQIKNVRGVGYFLSEVE
jgi:two-component system response regulator TctD